MAPYKEKQKQHPSKEYEVTGKYWEKNQEQTQLEVKLSLVLITHHATKTHYGVQV
jgi:hypothetical protein